MVKKMAQVGATQVVLTMGDDNDSPEVSVYATVSFDSNDRALVVRLLRDYGGQDELDSVVRRRIAGALDNLVQQPKLNL